MGCATSKQKRCRHCNNSPYSPVPRSYSMHVHHPPQTKGDSYHVVALQSTTLGSLKLDFNNITTTGHLTNSVSLDNDININVNAAVIDVKTETKEENNFNMGLVEAKHWSNMIQQKIPKIVPKTPIRTPPGEPETINTWELMAGLEDISPHRLSPNHFRSFSFDIVRHENQNHIGSRLSEHGSIRESDDIDKAKASFVNEFDPDVISSFKKSFEELSPTHPFYLKKQQIDTIDHIHKLKKEKVVLYITSLRGVRKTYEDCCNVRVIFKGLGVKVDERDVSMHSGFKDELKELLGDGYNKGGLPKVFIGKNYIGGAEEIRRMHEEGKLERVIEGCEMVEDDGCGINGVGCEACGDMRFVPCETCSGSCKVYYEHEEEEEDEELDESEFGFQRCPDCNENGLIRCPICCY